MRKLRLAALALVSLVAPGIARAKDAPAPPDWFLQAAATDATNPGDAPAIVLLEDKLITVGPDGHAVERYREVIRILKPQGRSYRSLVAPMSSDSKLLNFHAWSIGPDGHRYSVRDDETHDEAYGDYGMLYVDDRYRVARPPGADPGGIVGYEFLRQIPDYMSENTWGFQNPIPTVRSVFEIDLPPGWQHRALWCRHAASDPAEVAPNHFRWELANIDAIDRHDQPLSPSEGALAGRMVVHYAATPLPDGDALWARIGNWYQTLAAGQSEARQDIADTARKLTGSAAPATPVLVSPAADPDFVPKIRKIATFMQQQIRYVGIEIGIGGWKPHPAEDIFRNRYGDCKDKATLLIAMLDAVGIRATWVLVDTHRGFVDPHTPSIDGNHAIAAIELPASVKDPSLKAIVTTKKGRRFLIFDPTNPYVPIGLIPFYEQGGYGTLVLGQDSEAIELPVLAPDANTFERSAQFTLAPDGELKGTVSEKSFGASSDSVRGFFTNSSTKEQNERLEHRLHGDLSEFSLASATPGDAAALDRPFDLNYTIDAPSYAQKAGDLLLLRARVIGSDSEPFEDKQRRYPVALESEGSWRDSVSIALPAGYAVDELPEPTTVDAGFATYHSEAGVKDGAVTYNREYSVRKLAVPTDHYEQFRSFERAILRDEQQKIVLKKQ